MPNASYLHFFQPLAEPSQNIRLDYHELWSIVGDYSKYSLVRQYTTLIYMDRTLYNNNK